MNDTAIKNNIEKQFRMALQVLAIKPDEQVRALEPGDVPVEMCEDYLYYSTAYQQWFEHELDAETVDAIKRLTSKIEALPDTAFPQDSNLSAMGRPEWEPLRVEAQLLLKKLNWPFEPPPPFINEGDGVWRLR